MHNSGTTVQRPGPPPGAERWRMHVLWAIQGAGRRRKEGCIGRSSAGQARDRLRERRVPAAMVTFALAGCSLTAPHDVAHPFHRA